MNFKIVSIVFLLVLFFSCKDEKKTKIDATRLNDKVYLDSLEKSVANYKEFEKPFKDIDLNDFVNREKQQNETHKLKPFKDDLINITNNLRDTTEYGLEKIIELQTGEKVKINEIDFGKHLNDTTIRNKATNSNTVSNKNTKVKKDAIENGLSNLQKQFGIGEENMLTELLRDKSNNSVYNPKDDKRTKKLLSDIQNTNKEETTLLVAQHYNITTKELDILKKLPNASNIRTEKKALRIPKGGLPNEVLNHVKSGQASEEFIKITNLYKYAIKRNKKSFLGKSKKAKAKFKKLNPTWYSSKQAEEVYMDSKSKMIYLPLGKLSFADKVIEHRLGNPSGKFASGSIGEPNVAGLLLNAKIPDEVICNIGTKGVLIVQFTDNVLVNVNGPDLYVFEIGKIEPTQLEISKDGENWIDIGKIEGGTAYVDIHNFVKPNDSFSYVRLTDIETYSTVPGADVDAIATIGGALRLSLDSEVLFEVGKHQLKKAGIIAISKLAERIKVMQKGIITIEGHTDDTGSTQSNQALSKKRATSVSNELKHLITSKSFKWKEFGYGESRPIVKNNNDENRQINRRVEIVVIPTSN